MAKINVDRSEMPDSNVVPAGQYEVVVTAVTDLKTSAKGVSFIGVTFSIANEGEYVNRQLNEPYIPLEGNDARLNMLLNAAGFEKDILEDTEELIGLRLNLIVGIKMDEEYGEQNRIRTYLRPKPTE